MKRLLLLLLAAGVIGYYTQAGWAHGAEEHGKKEERQKKEEHGRHGHHDKDDAKEKRHHGKEEHGVEHAEKSHHDKKHKEEKGSENHGKEDGETQGRHEEDHQRKEGHGDEHGETGHHDREHAEHGKAGALHEHWQSVQSHVAHLNKVVEDEKWLNVHQAAFAARDALNAMIDKSDDVDDETKAKLKAYAQHVSTLAEQLDAAGDAEDAEGVRKLHPKFNLLIERIHKLYPEEQLKPQEKPDTGVEAEKDEHGEHEHSEDVDDKKKEEKSDHGEKHEHGN